MKSCNINLACSLGVLAHSSLLLHILKPANCVHVETHSRDRTVQ